MNDSEAQFVSMFANAADIVRLRSLEKRRWWEFWKPRGGTFKPGYADRSAEAATAYVMRIIELAASSHGQRQPVVTGSISDRNPQ